MAKPIATLRELCPNCKKPAIEVSRQVLAGYVFIKLECGHTMTKDQIEVPASEVLPEFTTVDGLHHAYPYQVRSAEFFERANLNGICAHEMGVGKMIIACMLMKRNQKTIKRTLFVCKSGLRSQAFLEIYRWTGMIPQVIESSNDLPYFEYFPICIISYDTLRLVRPDITMEWEALNGAREAAEFAGKQIKGNRKMKGSKIKWTDEICSQFDFIILDECQMIKNPDASRTRAIKKIASAWNRVPGSRQPRIMGLSGTPIKNDASEYATILHMVNPTMFPSETGFIARDCWPIGTSNRYRLRNPDQFHEKTKDFILRYTRAEVLPELPAIFRMFYHAELEGGDLEAYQKVVKEFQEFMEDLEDISMKDITNILGYFARMRRITGAAKVPAAVEFIEEFLLSTERKIVIFVHHKDTGNMLYTKLQKLCEDGAMEEPLMLVSSLSMQQRQEVLDQFKGVETIQEEDENGNRKYVEKPTGKNHRILIASTLSAGEGLNLQFCSDCIIMERQWNPANEEQAEARFPRPGQTADKINATYMIAAGSIDDFLTELVERKRSIVYSTLDNVQTQWDESSLIVELARTLQTKGLKKWAV